MLASSTPEIVNPVADACEAAGVPCISTVLPWEAWYFGRGAKPRTTRPPSSSPTTSASASRTSRPPTSTRGTPLKTNKNVGVMWPNDADGNAIRAALRPAAEEGRLHDRRPGRLQRRHQRLLGADREVQAEELRDLQHVPDPARTSPPSGGRPRSRATRPIRSPRSRRPACSRRRSRRSATSAYDLASGAYWTPTFPYKLVADEVDARSSPPATEADRQAVEPAARAEPGAVRRRHGRAEGQRRTRRTRRAVANAIATLKVDTPLGHLDWAKGPVPNVVATPIIGGQWVKAPNEQVPARADCRARTPTTRTCRSRRS